MNANLLTPKVVSVLSILLVPTMALADSPTGWVRATVGEVRNTLSAYGPGSTLSQDGLVQVSRVIEERFDFPEMARLALGQHWQQRSPEERKEFIMLFRQLLERSHIMQMTTKAEAEQRYLGEVIDGDRALVQAVVMAEDNEVPIDYALVRHNGTWKIYDLGIDGMRLSQIYRSEFNKVISRGSYADLIRRMQIKLQEITFGEEAQR
jgi:phospholipid transport system substrate-binding protein